MKKTNRVFQQFIIALCSLFISSACILFVPLVYNKSKATIICSVVFWVSLILGYTLIFLIHRKRINNKCSGRYSDGDTKETVGLWSVYHLFYYCIFISYALAL